MWRLIALDPLEVLMNIENVTPYFQPIISAENQCVIGYEVLGRIEMDGKVVSLGPFFQDLTIPAEYYTEVDERVRRQAFDYFLSHDDDELLIFINCNANMLMKDHGEQILRTFEEYRDRGFPYERIVLEITEHDYDGDISKLNHLLLYLQSMGMKIAIDDVGKGGGSIDRIALLNPDILKVDLHFLQNETVPQSFRDALYSLTILARKIGATLLFEGIGQLSQLNSAWRKGGRYYQGFYLAEPQADFIPRDSCLEQLKSQFHQFIIYERKKLNSLYLFSEQLNNRLQEMIKKIKNHGNYDEIVLQVAKELTTEAFRIYICDEDGFQKSANAFKETSGNWKLQPEYRSNNWSWRPYFLENIFRMSRKKRGILSDLYSDIETNELIRTFSYPINENAYIFIDLPYTFLYEQDGLL
ncbi:EAL-associated domain-containing protein [Anaerobacillus sp. MEB173]|uniref:EAL domain-containing protein n=1 Tax=Anaerobacillus sp. MEB173 TaxID=3383345 RepID=UPI003F8E2A24